MNGGGGAFGLCTIQLAIVRGNNLPMQCLIYCFFKAVFNIIGLFKHLINYVLTMPEASLFVRRLGLKNGF